MGDVDAGSPLLLHSHNVHTLTSDKDESMSPRSPN